LETGQRLLAALEDRRAADLRAQVATLAESPMLKAGLDTYEAERRAAPEGVRAQLLLTISRELDTLATRLDADVLVTRGPEGDVPAVSGRRAADWTTGDRDAGVGAGATLLGLPSGLFRLTTVPVMLQ